ncbi:chloride channel protein [Terriglobus tenax]|uniref:chloride channel protein n=1 Tax=Terriglobus tenax TaxID=1111115 RepID=UPI0021E0ED68|nr:chloride channel protein [Terriglobus tenax]
MPETGKKLLAWVALAAGIGVLAGLASALLIVALNWANATRESHHWLLAGLPLAGFAVGWLYWRYGGRAAGGNNLILEEIHTPTEAVPLRMAPLVLLGTVLTHLFGGSAGREGTAVQMGASLADWLAGLFGQKQMRRVALMAGIAGGFGGVFGTPWTGAIFGVEVLAVGWVGWNSVLEGLGPCLIASFAGDLTVHLMGVHHTEYHIGAAPALVPIHWVWAAVAGVVFGLIARLFSTLHHGLSHLFKKMLAYPPMRPLVGGTLVALLIWGLRAWQFAGLGVPGILASFDGQQPWWVWAAKLGLTALTLGAGFKGGEVTPLFFMGAAAGSTMAGLVPLSVGVLAAMGFAAVFSAAANTPLAGVVMAMELFGGRVGALAGLACVTAYLFSGPVGIYSSQLPIMVRWKMWMEKK